MQVIDLQQADYDESFSKESASAVDSMFKKIAKNSTGFYIWKIATINSDIVAIPKNLYGQFYDSNAYVILASSLHGESATVDTVVRKVVGASLEYHIHFWLGCSTTADKSGVAAYKAVELDGYLGGSTIQHRETQGNESVRFRSYFQDGIWVLKGKYGVNDESVPKVYPTLYKIKGKRNPVIIEQESIAWKHFNSGDVFVLASQKVIFVWIGRAAGGTEKMMATKIAVQLKTENNNTPDIIFVDDGYEQSVQTEEKAEFERYLPLSQRHVLPSEPIDDEAADKQSPQHRNHIKLYKCLENGGKYRVAELKSGPLFQCDLDSDNVFILDQSIFGIWIWVGKSASDKERTEAMRNARGFVKKKKYPNETNVTRVIDGVEPVEFKTLFPAWKNKDHIVAHKNKKLAITKFDSTLFNNRPALAAETQLMDDGSGSVRVWRINNRNLVEIPKNNVGRFFSGDCYLVLYKYECPSPRHVLISWFGSHAVAEEMAHTIAKITELEREFGESTVKMRIMQGYEPPQLLQIFNGKLSIFGGKGTDYDGTGRNGNTPSNCLLRIQGCATYNTRAIQVDTKASSLDSNYCFVLASAKQYYVWSGLNSTGDQREMAKRFTSKDFELILEGKEPQEFWELLRGKGDYVRSKIVNAETEFIRPRLIYCYGNSKIFKAEEVFNFRQSDLSPEDIMLLDATTTIFIWIGKLALYQNNSLELVLEYLRNDPAGRDVNLPIIEIKQQHEPPLFTGFFPNWKANWWSEYVSFEELRHQLGGGARDNNPTTVNKNGEINDFDKYEKYPISMLKESAEKLPSKVDPLKRELHLTHDDFVFLFQMDYQEFCTLPKWKQQEIKKKLGLF